ncbi:uncharacterized protein A4U43_C05F21540 [Asparagus officinalis]|uniref:Oleosin n=1 Tax=Asparagus officinalis TaxID=4686 RepID=A0A5P1EUR1_ASPOF|nr:oleosin S1-2 [Asparagus officinalis]ONK69313.1 uncharacterized protein A4U43_C05F21540 [Asparagus officinalis]
MAEITGTTVLYATVASVIVGGPLLGMMGFVLLATTTLLLIAAPLMLLFSPIIVPAAFLLAASMVSFGVAVIMGFAGLSTLTWAFRSVGILPGGIGWVSREKVEGGGMDFGEYLKKKGGAYEPRISWPERS